jgi:hypothetical protein
VPAGIREFGCCAECCGLVADVVCSGMARSVGAGCLMIAAIQDKTLSCGMVMRMGLAAHPTMAHLRCDTATDGRIRQQTFQPCETSLYARQGVEAKTVSYPEPGAGIHNHGARGAWCSPLP